MAEFRIRAINPSNGEATYLAYDNATSSLTHADTGAPVCEASPVAQRGPAPAVSQDSPLHKSSPRILKISLGLSCNYECEYCSQRFVPRAAETNPGAVDEFVRSLDEWVTTPPQKIEFWGGEPFVYIKTLRPLAEALRVKYPDTAFSVITNGSLLTLDLNEWIDSLGFFVGISHDGPGQHVRGPDPLDNPATREAILDLYRRLRPDNRISFNAMLNRLNVSRSAIQKFFVELTGDPTVPIGEGGFVDAYDEGGKATSLTPGEQAPFRNQAFHELRTGQATNFQNVSQRLMDFVSSIKTARPASVLGQKCGMDDPSRLAVDLKGNVLTCQNTSIEGIAPNGMSHKIGHVSDLAGVKLNTSTHWSKRDECPRCPVLQVCKGSCMFLEGDLWDASCDNAFSDAIPTFAAGIEFLTGMVPVYIEGPQRADRKDIWNRQEPVRRKTIPIAVATAPTT